MKYPVAQRTALARGVIHNPKMLLCDEPTGNLDSMTSNKVLELLESLHKTDRMTILLVTHDPVAASYCQRVIFIKDGQLFNEIDRGESRQQFFQRIIDFLSFMGGDVRDLLAFRR